MKLFEIKSKQSGPKTSGAGAIHRLEDLLAKKMGVTLYRYGGKNGVLNGKSGDKGYLYFFGKHAFRLDYDASEQRVAHIDYWADAAHSITGKQHADYQLDLPRNVSLFKLITQVATFLKRPKKGDIEINVSTLSEGFVDTLKYDLLEAKRVSKETFIMKAKEYAGKSGKKDLVFTYDDLRDVSKAYDIFIPGTIYDIGIGTKSDEHYDLGRVEQDASGTIIAVHAGASVKVMHFEHPSATEVDEKILMNSITEKLSTAELFDDLERLVRIVGRGSRPALLVYGGPGTGKTKTITDTIKDLGLTKGNDYMVVKGKVSPMSLFMTMFLNREKLIILDDTDSVWDNDDSVNILKAALDSGEVRTVDWISPLTQNVTRMSEEERKAYEQLVFDKLSDDPTAKVKMPSSFEFTGQVIFISNRPRETLDSAVLNRSLSIDMTLTTDQAFERIEQLMDKLSAPNSMTLTRETKLEVLDFLKDQSKSGKLKYVSIRTFVGAMGVASSGDPEWRRLLKYMGSD